MARFRPFTGRHMELPPYRTGQVDSCPYRHAGQVHAEQGEVMSGTFASSAGVAKFPVLDKLERLVGGIGELQTKLILLVCNGIVLLAVRIDGSRAERLLSVVQ